MFQYYISRHDSFSNAVQYYLSSFIFTNYVCVSLCSLAPVALVYIAIHSIVQLLYRVAEIVCKYEEYQASNYAL